MDTGVRPAPPRVRGAGRTITLVAGLRLNGITAPALVDGAMDGETFLTWVRGMLVKELKPGDMVVMDNLPAHKVAGVREAVEAAGARIAYLPPPDQVPGRLYSPDFNPIDFALPRHRFERAGGGLLQAQGPLAQSQRAHRP